MEITDTVQARAYLKYHDRDSFVWESTESDSGDDWEIGQAGFRLDGQAGERDSWTLHGDIYKSDEHQIAPTIWSTNPPYLLQNVEENFDTSGWNILGQWNHKISETSSWTFQAYFDSTYRDEIFLEQQHRTFDVDFQHQFQAGERHDLIWGISYRAINDDFENTFQVSLDPDSQTSELFTAFLQDEIILIPDTLWLTIGSKFEKNDYTGEEIQPSGRILWKIQENQTAWAAVSRAVRTPSRIEDSGRITMGVIPIGLPPIPPAVISITSNSDLKSEELIAYEAGYRFTQNHQWTMDIALFYNDYDNLVTWETLPSGNLTIANNMQGKSYGAELTSRWQPLEWLTIQASYTYQQFDMDTDSRSSDTISGPILEESSPEHQISLLSSLDLGKKWQLNLFCRYVDTLKKSSYAATVNNIVIDDYLDLDANLIWRPREDLEITLAGQNLLDSSHMEFMQIFFTGATEVERGVYGKVTWRF